MVKMKLCESERWQLISAKPSHEIMQDMHFKILILQTVEVCWNWVKYKATKAYKSGGQQEESDTLNTL